MMEISGKNFAAIFYHRVGSRISARRLQMPPASAPLCLAVLLLAVLPLAAKPIRVSGQIQGPAGARVELLPQSGAPPVAATTTAFGRVLDREKRPVQGAELVLTPASEGVFSDRLSMGSEEEVAQAISNPEGRFELQHLNPGRFRLRVKHKGFSPFALPEIEIPPGTARVDLGILTLDRGLVIEGRVTDPRGVPLPDVDVSLNTQITLFTMGPDNQDSPAQAQTGPEGRFRFDDLRRGAKFELRVERQGYVPASVRVDVPAPESLAIKLKPGRTLTGRVTGPAGEPVRNAILSLREETNLRLPEGLPKIDGWRHLGATDEEGKFRAEGVPPGTADLSIFAPGYRSKQPPGIPVPEDRDVEGLEIALEKASALEIRVLDSQGKPVDGAWIEVQRTDSPTSERRGRTDAEGRCLLDGIEPGRYEVSARSEEQGQARTTLDATAGVTARELVLAKGVEVSGRVSDESGEPVPGASLSLRPVGKGATLTAHAAADGTFRVQSVGDGTFRLSGSAPDFAETFAPAEVQVAGQEIRGLDLRLSRGTTLTGRVLGLDPEELGSVLVLAVRPDQASFQPLQGRVDGQGRYRIEGLGPGDWQVVAHQMKGRSLLEPLQIATGRREAVLDLRFQTGFTLSGQVLVDRAPFAGAEVQVFTRDRSVQAQTGPDGRFQVPDLPADSYSLRVLDLEHGLSATRSVEVIGDQAITLEIAAGGLRGKVSSAGGEPITGAFIRLEEAVPEMPYPFQMPGGTSDVAGAFEIPRIYAGTYRIIVEKEGFAAYTANVEIRPGAPTPVAIELKPLP
jgi:protocatechuate 3,4-dioxygenase beta subunit